MKKNLKFKNHCVVVVIGYVSVSVKCFTFVNVLKHGVRMFESLNDSSMVNYVRIAG